MRFLLSSLALLFVACAGEQPLNLAEPTGSVPILAQGQGRAGPLVVYGQNIAIGTDVDAVIAALASPDLTDDLPAILRELQVLAETDFTARAAAFAAHIAGTRPHVVGLNEIYRIDVDLSPFGGPTVHEDFLPELLAALANEGLDYEVAGQVQNTLAAPVPGIQLIDWDVLLVDATRVTVGPGVVARNFTQNEGQVAPGVFLIRGWVMAPVTIGGKRYNVVATHPESGSQPAIALLRATQMTELVASLDPQVTTILLGDFNDAPGSPMYQVITGAGFIDVWADLRSKKAGFTCCYPPDLSVGPASVLTRRYDYVFVRRATGSATLVNGTIDLFGDRKGDILHGLTRPIWPSDHAGLVAKLVLPPAKGLAD